MFSGTILALDLSAKNTGVAEGRPGSIPRLYSEPFKTRDGDEERRTHGHCLKWIAERIAVSRPDVIVVEAQLDTLLQNSIKSVRLIAGLHGVINAASWNKGIRQVDLKVYDIRKHFLGSGRIPGVKGEAVKRLVRARCYDLGWEPPNLDAADAAAVFALASWQLAPDAGVPPIHASWWRDKLPQKKMTWGGDA